MHIRDTSGNTTGTQVTGREQFPAIAIHVRTSYMAFNIHKPLRCAGHESAVEALQLPTQIVIPSNATKETPGLNDPLQPYSKAPSVPMAV